MSDTMGQTLQRHRIPVAAFIALVFIGGSIYISRHLSTPVAQASPESALLNAIATRDSDGDGLPDWQEALYGTDPHTIDTQKLGMSDAEAVAKGLIVPKAVADIPTASDSGTASSDEPFADGTLTSLFAQNLMAAYVSAKEAKGGADLTEDEMFAVANEAVTQTSKTLTPAPAFKNLSDLKIGEAGPVSMRAYVASVDAIFEKNKSTGGKSDLTYLQEVVSGTDQKAVGHLSSLASTYRAVAAGIALVAVPQEAAAAHLKLVNSTMRLGQIISDFARVNTDPLAAILGLQQYPQAALLFAQSLSELGAIVASEQISIQSGQPGAAFLDLLQSAAKTSVH